MSFQPSPLKSAATALSPVPMPITRLAVWIVCTLGVGLAIDVRTDLPGQVVLSAGVWAVFFYLLRHVDYRERQSLFACLAVATAGELFLSLVWGLYTYRLGSVPMFVPPGHAMLLLLALRVSQRMSAGAAKAILSCAAAYAVIAAATGMDTFGLLLISAIALVSCAMPTHRALYASTFIIALALELYGTWLGNWTWSREVPIVGLVTTNPPGVASAFYAVLDALVACTAFAIARRASFARGTAMNASVPGSVKVR